MIIVQRFVPILTPLLTGCLWLIATYNVVYYYYFIATILLVVIIAIAKLMDWKFISVHFVSFLLAPLLLQVSLSFFLIFQDSQLLRYFMIILTTVVFGIYLESCFNYLHHTKGYQPYALANVSSYAIIYSIWLFFSGVYALATFLNTPWWILLCITAPVIALSILQTMWIENISLRQNYLMSLVLLLVIVEIFWVLLYLPLSWMVNGLVITVFYYFFVNLGRYDISKSLDRSVFLRYFLISCFMLFAILITAQWF